MRSARVGATTAVILGLAGGPALASAIRETPIPTPKSLPAAIVAGLDGALWFTEEDGNKIGRITTAGTITEFALPIADIPTLMTVPEGSRPVQTARCGSPRPTARESGASRPPCA